MRKSGFLAAAVLFFVLAGSVQAENDICQLKKLPPHPSANSSMLIIIPEYDVDTNATMLYTLTDPIKVHWEVIDQITYEYIDRGGSFHKFGNCWICEFSGKDSGMDANCGPMPFKTSGTYVMDFYANDFDSSVEFSRTGILIHPESMRSGVIIDEKGVRISAETPPTTQDPATITIYNAETGEMLSLYEAVNMTQGAYPGLFYINITTDDLVPGTYYVSIDFTTSTGSSGGDLLKIVVREEDIQLTAETDKSSYYVGETVEISGKSQEDTVTAVIRYPSGSTQSLGETDVDDDEYKYLFHITSEDEGDYEVTVMAGDASVERVFSVTGKLIDVDPTSLSFLIEDLSTAPEEVVTIRNNGSSSVKILIVKEGLTDEIQTDLDDSTLSADSETTLTVAVDPSTLTQTRTTGKLHIKAGDITIPVDIKINLDLPSVSPGGEKLEVDPAFWTIPDCMIDEPVEKTFTLKNTGEGEIDNFDYTDTGVEVTDVTFPESVGSTPKSMTLEITPKSPSAEGEIRVTSSGGTAKIHVSTDCISQSFGDDVSDLEESVYTLIAEFEDSGFDTSKIDDIFYTINAELESARDNLESGEYSYALESYASARARLETLQEVYLAGAVTTVPEAGDMSWIYIVVVVVVIAVVGFFLYARFGDRLFKRGGQEETVEDEELY